MTFAVERLQKTNDPQRFTKTNYPYYGSRRKNFKRYLRSDECSYTPILLTKKPRVRVFFFRHKMFVPITVCSRRTIYKPNWKTVAELGRVGEIRTNLRLRSWNVFIVRHFRRNASNSFGRALVHDFGTYERQRADVRYFRRTTFRPSKKKKHRAHADDYRRGRLD